MTADTIRTDSESVAASVRREAAFLRVVHAPDPASVGQKIPLGHGQTVFVGRELTDGFRVRDERMSKVHFLVVSTRGSFECADANSTNGTFVNGLPCKSVSLVQGDVIRAGDTLFVVTTRDFAAEMNDLIARVAHAPFPVLLTGETGSGKEVTARAIHAGSARRGPFVALNCATLSRDLAAAELFGHVSGAFSGAGAPRPGLFRAAEGGTLFLDEIGDLPLDIQASLLRAIEERRVRPVGSDKEIPIDVRLLSATHVDLERAVEARAFRADLFSRLAHLVIQVPPLRERRAEILELASKFAPEVTISANAAEALLLWSWPRNVRELRAVVEVSQLLSRGRSTLRLSDLKDRLPQTLSLIRSRKSEPPGAGEGEPDRHPLADRREQLTLLLETHSGNIKKIADELGKPRAQVYRWVKSLGLDLDRFRKV